MELILPCTKCLHVITSRINGHSKRKASTKSELQLGCFAHTAKLATLEEKEKKKRAGKEGKKKRKRQTKKVSE
jgi:hypothetical protein